MAALPLLNQGTTKVKAARLLHALSVVMCAVMLAFLGEVQVPVVTFLLRFLVTVIMGYCGWHALVVSNFELNGIESTRKDINNILRCNPNNM